MERSWEAETGGPYVGVQSRHGETPPSQKKEIKLKKGWDVVLRKGPGFDPQYRKMKVCGGGGKTGRKKGG